MKVGFALLLIICLSANGFNAIAQDGAWERISDGIDGCYRVLANPSDPGIMFLGTSRGLYRTDDNGAKWKHVLAGRNMAVKDLAFAADDPNTLYAASSSGLYRSNDLGRGWQRVYKGRSAAESYCNSVLVIPGTIFCGTDAGLVSSGDNGVKWDRQPGPLSKIRITSLRSGHSRSADIFAAAEGGIYRKKVADVFWERVMIDSGSESGAQNDNADTDTVADYENGEENKHTKISCLAADPYNDGVIYSAARDKVYKSADSGATWQVVPDSGLIENDIRVVAIGRDFSLYAGGRKGVFKYRDGQWSALDSGMPEGGARDIIFSHNRILAAADSGLYMLKAADPITNSGGGSQMPYTRGLPSIASVQKAAIIYGDADISKIESWRKDAKRKAFLPKLGIGFDRDNSDLWHWEGGSTTRENDDILRRGKDSVEWDISLDWDLGDLIWNSDQTSIDTRARLLVQLRDDILNEVTKLYFEYVRTRLQLDSLPVGDTKKLDEKMIRLQELSAQIDGLTDGYFTANLSNR